MVSIVRRLVPPLLLSVFAASVCAGSHQTPADAVIAAAKAAKIWTPEREAELTAPLSKFFLNSMDKLCSLSFLQWRQDIKLHPLVINHLMASGILPVDKRSETPASFMEIQQKGPTSGTDQSNTEDPSGEADSKTTEAFSISKFMGKLLVGYDGDVRPFHGKHALEVIASFTLFAVTTVNQIDQEVEMVLKSTVKFLDPRLLFTAEDIKPLTYVTCFPTYKGRLWEPNWLFLNAVEVHGPVRETLLLRPKGKMELSGYFTVKFFSPFDLTKFPFDNQAYTIQVQMWDQPDEEVHLHFPKSGNAINIVSADTSLWYVSTTNNRTSTSLSVNKMSSGSFTTLTGKVYVQRGIASYIISYILPVNLIALISYFGYFMDPRGGMGRDQISITSYLALIVFQNVINSALPPCATTTWLQIYLTAYSFVIVWSPISFVLTAMLARDPGGWYDELLNQIEGESKDSEERASLVSTGANSDDLEAMSHKKKAVRLDLLSRKLIPISIAIVNLGSFIYLVWL